jgi:hypothetical protein
MLKGNEVAEVLERAACRVDAGWTQGAPARAAPTAEYPKGQVLSCADSRADLFCAAGALARAAMEIATPSVFRPRHSAREVLGDYVGSVDRELGRGYSLADELTAAAGGYLLEVIKPAWPEDLRAYSLFYWNDAPERTQAEVVAALRTAAERARSMPGKEGA